MVLQEPWRMWWDKEVQWATVRLDMARVNAIEQTVQIASPGWEVRGTLGEHEQRGDAKCECGLLDAE